MLFKLAFRNIFRHFTRTFLTFFAITPVKDLDVAGLIINDPVK